MADAPAPSTLAGPLKWVGFRHSHWQKMAKRWIYTRDHYTGDVLDESKLSMYLHQKRQGEHNEAYKERQVNADYTAHLAALVDSLVGILSAVEHMAKRVWGKASEDGKTVKGLGDPADPTSIAYRLTHNADGNGTSWSSFWSKYGNELTLTLEVGLMVDGRDGESVVRMICPEHIVNWKDAVGGGLTDMMIEEARDARRSFQDDPSMQAQWLHLHPEGWTRYRIKTANGRATFEEVPQDEGGSGIWSIPLKNAEDVPIIPARWVRVPLGRSVGWNLAKKANSLFNRESERDNLLRVGNFPKFLVDGTATDYKKILESFRKGENVIHGKGDYKTPPTEAAAIATEVLEKKAREFYMVGFREYGDAAKEVTATEAKQRVAAGPAAYLSLLASALDEAETWALHIIEQYELEGKKELHKVASVTRSRDFLPEDPEAATDRLIARVFGKDVPVPVGRTGQVSAARKIADLMGIKVEDAELEAAVTAKVLTQMMAAAVTLPFPAQVRVIAMEKVLGSSGMIDPEATIAGVDGKPLNLLKVLREQASRLAEAQDESKRREAETFGAGNGFPPRGGGPAADE